MILETSKRLLATGHHTEVLCPNAMASTAEEMFDGVRVRRVPYFYPYIGLSDESRRRMDHKGGNMFSFALLRELKAMPSLDVIHLHTANRIGGIGRHVARQRDIPYIVSLHGGVHDVPPEEALAWTDPTRGALEWGKALGWWVGSRRVLDDAGAIICVGQEEFLQTSARFPHQRVVHLPNGVDSSRFARGDGEGFRRRHGIGAKARVILTIGRIDPQKNQSLAVKVLEGLLATDPEAHLLLIGPITHQAYHDGLVAEVRDRGLERRVTIILGLDAQDQEVVDAYHAGSVFLLPSIHEPFGIVILEAWAAGLPVVASRVGGVPSFVSHGINGVLFESGNLAEATAAVRALFEEAPRARALAEAGRQLARESYGWDRVTTQLVSIYEQAIADRRAARA